MCCGCCGARGTSLQRRDLSEGKLQSSPMVARRAESCGHSGRSGLEAEGWPRRLLGPLREGVCGSGSGQPEPSSTFPAHEDPLWPVSEVLSDLWRQSQHFWEMGMGTGDRMWAQPLPSPWTWLGLPLASSVVLPSAGVFSPVCSVSHPLKPNSLHTCKLV